MKKLVIILAFVFASCFEARKVETIEKYKGFVVARKNEGYSKVGEPYACFIVLKNRDTIVETNVLTFDAKRYNVGDTIK
jgi:hypothetical protein